MTEKLIIIAMRKYNKISTQEYASRFSDPFLREVFPFVLDYRPGFSVFGFLHGLAHFHGRNAGWPVGGSLAFARAIERRYLGLGGEVQYRARVEKVLVLAGFLHGLGNDDRNDGQVDEQDATFAR